MEYRDPLEESSGLFSTTEKNTCNVMALQGSSIQGKALQDSQQGCYKNDEHFSARLSGNCGKM